MNEDKKPSSYTKRTEQFKTVQSNLSAVQSEFESVKKELTELKNAKVVKGNHISSTIPYVQTLIRIRQDISTYRNALLRAENLHSPNRIELYRTYKDVMLDGHLSATIQNRKASILSSEFKITKGGNKVQALSEMFDSKWFYDFVSLSLDSMYFGFSVIEFGDLIDKEFSSIKLIPREYVKPELGIVGATPEALEGAPYKELPYSDWCIGVGEEMDLGLLAKASPYVLWKKGAIMAYAEYSEMMGVPIRILKTDVYDEETRQAGENFMRNLGNSAYAVIGKDDEVQFAEAKNAAGAEKMFNGLINTMNEELSKLILGGTGNMTAKSFVGAANVHQENFLTICGQDKLFLQHIMNYQLIPFLIRHGFALKGCKIEIEPDEELSLTERFAIDSKLLDYYKIPASYFNEKYNTKLEEKSEDGLPDLPKQAPVGEAPVPALPINNEIKNNEQSSK